MTKKGDRFIDFVLFGNAGRGARYLKIAFTVDSESYFDEVLVTPEFRTCF